jgi:hypothetical protein
MFNIFKKRYQKKVVFAGWKVNPGGDFELVDNGDSIQYVNDSGSIVIYLSVLEVQGRTLHADEPIFAEPKIVAEGELLHLKGAKMGEGKVLICAITFSSMDEAQWVKDYFDSIART